MNRQTLCLVPAALSAVLVAGCGGKSAASGPVGNTTGEVGATLAGDHQCQFVVDGGAMGPHHCDISGATITKLTGFEPFTGTLAPAADGLRLDAAIGCVDLTTRCHQKFSVTLREDGGVWRGQVEGQDAPADWFLNGATFEVLPAAFGGDGYGGSGYGGYGGE